MKQKLFLISAALLVAGSLFAAGPVVIKGGKLGSDLDAAGFAILNASTFNGVTLTLPIATTQGGTGLTTLGTALQVLRVNAAGTALEFATGGGGGGSGDVVGPASAVNNRVVFFDGTTGKLIKDSGLTLSGSNTGDQINVTGNAGTATLLQNARTINGVSFNGGANITVPAAGSTLTDTVPFGKGGTGLTALGTSLQVLRTNSGATGMEWASISVGGGDALTSNNLDQFAGVTQTGGTTLSITSGTTTLAGGSLSGTNTGDQTTITGNAGTATLLQNARTINGVSFNGSANITVPAAGSTLTDTVPFGKGGTGLTALGTSLQVLRTNAAGTAMEWGTVSGGGGSGDVVGPGSATDNAITRFDATTGKIVQNSGITIADGASGALSGTNTGDQTITLTGPVTGSGTGSFATLITDGSVVLADLANMATASVYYRKTAGSGAPEVNTLATLKTDLGLSGTNTGDQTTITGNAGTATTLQNARTINGVSFNGSANITIQVPVATGITGLGTGVPALLATTTGGVDSFSEFALAANLGTLAFEDTLDFAALTGRASYAQLNRARTVVTEAATVTIPVNSMIKTSATGTMTTLAFGAGTPTEGQSQVAEVNFGSGLTYPFTVTFPTCKRLGENTSRTTLAIPAAGIHEFNWVYVNGEYLLADSVASAGGSTEVLDTVYSSAWNGVTTNAGSMNVTYDYLHISDTDDDGKTNVLDQVAGIVNTNSSGVIQTPATLPSGTIVGTTETQTLTNKQINPRVNAVASSTSWTPDFDTYDQEALTALAGNITAVNAPTGTPNDGQRRILRITNNATPHTIGGWNAIYRVIGVTLPTTIAASKTIYIGVIYNSAATKWDVVAVGTEA